MLQYLREFPVTLGLAFLTLLVFIIPQAEATLDYQIGSPFFDQWFQLIGCHLAHWSADHLMWDLVMFVLMGAICEKQNRKVYVAVLMASAVLIPIGVSFMTNGIDSYRGLSGVDTALFGMAMWYLVGNAREDRNWWGVGIYSLLFVGMFAKIGYEYLTGGTLFTEGGNFIAVPSAHLVGAVIGCLAGCFEILRSSNFKASRKRSINRKIQRSLKPHKETLR